MKTTLKFLTALAAMALLTGCNGYTGGGTAGGNTVGNAVLTGVGVPSDTIGTAGGLYLDIQSGMLYVKGQDGKWAENSKIGGPAFYHGDKAPDATVGSNGDSYLDYKTGNFYVKENGAWVSKGILSESEAPAESSQETSQQSSETSQGGNTSQGGGTTSQGGNTSQGGGTTSQGGNTSQGGGTSQGPSETMTLSEKGLTADQKPASIAGTNFSIAFDVGTNNQDTEYEKLSPTWVVNTNNNTADLRVYTGNTMTFTSAKNIVAIEFTVTTDKLNALSADSGTYSYTQQSTTATWTGEGVKSIVFSATNEKDGSGKANQFRFTAVKVTFAE